MELNTVLDNLKKHIKFKDKTLPGDIILVGMPSGLFYGIVHEIDNNQKKNWYNVSFKLLTIPPLDVTWILRRPQMEGEIFTINDEQHFLIAVDITTPQKKQPAPPHEKVSHLKLVKKQQE